MYNLEEPFISENSRFEVNDVINKLKNNKSVRENNTVVEIMKNSGEAIRMKFEN